MRYAQELREAVVRVVTRYAYVVSGVSIGVSVRRVFGISQPAKWISSRRWALLRGEQSAKTVSGTERHGSRLGMRKRILFAASVEPAD